MNVERLFEEHYRMVFLAAYRVTGRAGDAEDVLQTVFLRILRRDADAEKLEDPEAYLRRAAVNSAMDLMRSRQAARTVPLEDLEPTLEADPSRAPDRVLFSGEFRTWLRATVARLSPRAAEMFALRFYEGKSAAEIARTLGTTEGSVAVTLHRARRRIEQEYRAYWGGRHASR